MLKSKEQNQPFNCFLLQKKNNPFLFCLLRIRGLFSYNHPVICRDRDSFKQSSACLPVFFSAPKAHLSFPCSLRTARRGCFFLRTTEREKKKNKPLAHNKTPMKAPLLTVALAPKVQGVALAPKVQVQEKKASYGLSFFFFRPSRLLPTDPFLRRKVSTASLFSRKKKENLFHQKSSYLLSKPLIFNQHTLRTLDGSPSVVRRKASFGPFFLQRSPSDSDSKKIIVRRKPSFGLRKASHLKPLVKTSEKEETVESELEEGSNTKKSRFFKERNAYLIPDFVEIQRKSFFQLLEKGLIEEFSKRNPITNKNLEIFFYPEYYQLTPPEYNPRRAILISKSYSSKLFVPAQLTDKKLKKSQLKWVLIGNLPLMTKRGHFVLNGAPRVIVNQILRSPGIYFQGSLKEIFSDQWSEKPEITYKRFYTDLICLRGTWLRIEIDKNKDIWAQMKKVPKIPLLWFLLAMGLTERIIFKSVINPTRLLSNFNLEIKRKLDYEYVTNAADAWKAISNLISSSTKETSSYAVSVAKQAPNSTIPESTPWLASSDSVLDSDLDLSEELDANFAPKSGSPSSLVTKPGKRLLSQASSLLSGNKRLMSDKTNPFLSLLPVPSLGLASYGQQEGVAPSVQASAFGTAFVAEPYFPYLEGVAPSVQEGEEHGKEQEARPCTEGATPSCTEGATPSFGCTEGATPSVAPKVQGLATQEAKGYGKSPFSKTGVKDQNTQVIGSANSLPEKDFRSKESELRGKEALLSGIGTERKLVSFLNIVEHSKEGRNWIFKRFMNPRAYDLGTQGRLNFNRKLGLSISSHQTTLTAQDVLFATDYLFKVEKGLKNIDDIDHLKNRRVRTSGELLQIQIGIGLVRLEKIIREKFSKINAQTRASDFLTSRPNNPKTRREALKFEASLRAPTNLAVSSKEGSPDGRKSSPGKGEKRQLKGTRSEEVYGGPSSLGEEFKMNNLINTKAFNGALREFFGSSQLSQFMDQLNPLAEITHKRRLSSMGPGGVTRDSATLAIRGIHPTHYGRICPIETPEGKNTGLVNSLTTYSRASSQGFLESPFYKVYKGQVQKNAGMFFLSAEQEENIKVAAADVATPSGRIGFLPKNKIPAKIAYGDTISKISRNIVEYIGVSPIQMISIATSLIPFVEHDDANRALMGSNMQRQAVPLVRAERPLVGTGLESRTVSDSGHAVIAKESGYVAYVSGKKMLIYTIPTNN